MILDFPLVMASVWHVCGGVHGASMCPVDTEAAVGSASKPKAAGELGQLMALAAPRRAE